MISNQWANTAGSGSGGPDRKNEEEGLRIRVHGGVDCPTLIYLPGIHGDWTLISSFRVAVAGRVRFVEFIYPRTLDWSLDDYARAIARALADQGIKRGWLLGESFGSQLVWPFFQAEFEASGFQPDGVILAGGFVRYPARALVGVADAICGGISLPSLTRFLYVYAKYARFRHRHAPETMACIDEFIARRTELDKLAAQHRLRLIARNDPSSTVRKLQLPLFHLSGFIDPIVPWWLVRPWLRRNCPGYRGSRVIGSADHNVLSTAPRDAAKQVLEWMGADAPQKC